MDVWKKTRAPLLLLILVIVPLWDLLWLPSDQLVTGNDLEHLFLHWWRFSADSLRQGELPLWNPHLFSGIPFAANPQPALFYPLAWLILALPLARVATVLFCLHIWLAAVGMRAWLRSEGADEAGALLGAVVFGFSGYFFVRLNGGHIGVVMTQAWLPLILWVFHSALKEGRLTRAILGGLPVALSLLAGHTASFLYVGLVLAAYAVYRAWDAWQSSDAAITWSKPLVYVGLMFLVGLGLAAVQLVPTWEFLQLSSRHDTSYTFSANHSWPPSHLLTLFIPNFFGQPGRIGYWGEGIYTELIFYTGVLPLILLLVLGFRRKMQHHLSVFLLTIGGAGLLLALGQFSILHRLAYDFIPLFQITRAPARAGFLFAFAVAALGGLLLTQLRQQPEEARPSLLKWTQSPFPWLIAALTVLVILTGFILFGVLRESNPQVGQLWHTASSSALFLLLFVLTVGLLHAWGRGRLQSRQGALLAVGLVLLDLWGFGRSLLQPVPFVESAYWRIVADMSQAEEGDGRVLPWGLSVFEQNKGMAFGLENVFGYDPLELERYSHFITSVSDPQAQAYDLLNARYLVTTQEMDFGSQDPTATPQLLGGEAGVWVYERPSTLPPAWLVHQVELSASEAVLAHLNDPAFDPQLAVLLEQDPGCMLSPPTLDPTEAAQQNNVEFQRQGNNRIEVQVQAPSDGILVLSQAFYPGWRATLDGEPMPIMRANYVLQAVCVPAGAHRVVLTFAPSSLWIGAGISLFSLLVVAVAALIQARSLRFHTTSTVSP
jgi:hypothetical protein